MVFKTPVQSSGVLKPIIVVTNIVATNISHVYILQILFTFDQQLDLISKVFE